MQKDYAIIEKYSDYSAIYVGYPKNGLIILVDLLIRQGIGDVERYEEIFSDPEDLGFDGNAVNLTQDSGNVILTPGCYSELNSCSEREYPYTFILPIPNFLKMVRDWGVIKAQKPRTIRVHRIGDEILFTILPEQVSRALISRDGMPPLKIFLHVEGGDDTHSSPAPWRGPAPTLPDGNALEVLIEFLASSLILRAPWYKQFVANPDEYLLHGSHLEVSKEGSLIIIKELNALLDVSEIPQEFSLEAHDFVRILDEWCSAYAQLSKNILVSYQDGRVSIRPYEP